MPSKPEDSYRRYMIVAAIIGIFILSEFAAVFIFGRGVAPGYP